MKRVLVIDDDRETANLIKQVLSENGYDVEISADARAGFETAKSTVPDLIFISLMLSGINGLKVSKAIHSVKSLENVPIIMILVNEGELDVKYTATIGVIDTLVKPLNRKQLLTKTAAALGLPVAEDMPVEEIQEIKIEDVEEPFSIIEESPATAVDADFNVHYKAEEILENVDIIKEEEVIMPQKDNPFEKNDSSEENLFSEEKDLFSHELRRSKDEVAEQSVEDIPDYEPVAGYDDKPAMSVKRILFIVASIVVGIILGVGGYLFFTAGSKPTSVQRTDAKASPEHTTVLPPAGHSIEKPVTVPDVAAKPDGIAPDAAKSEPVQQAAKPQEPVAKAVTESPKKEANKKAESLKTTPEQSETVKSEIKKPASVKQAKKKGVTATGKGQKYFVQAGLFESEKNAETVAGQLKKHGYKPSINKIDTKDGKILYRVVAGSYSSFQKAVEVSDSLNKAGIKTIVHKQ